MQNNYSLASHDARVSAELEFLSIGLANPLSILLSLPRLGTEAPNSTSCPSSSSSLGTGEPLMLPAALPLIPPGPDMLLRNLLAWNVRLAVAFENKGNRYLSSSAWNHFPSSPIPAAGAAEVGRGG